ncbi:hypothetical protein LTR94_026315, partial [Friedmanniomyces endolithicus]
MVRHAPTRLAGMIAATATFVVLATETTAQETPLCDPQTGSTCSSTQRQTGDVTGTVNLNISVDQLEVSNNARGNSLAGGIEDSFGAMTSRQTMSGSTRANTTLVLNGSSEGPVVSTTDARANYVGVTTDGSSFAIDAQQSAVGERVEATTSIQAPTYHALGGMAGGSLAVANSVAMGGPSSVITGSVGQNSQTTVFAETVADVQYIPAPADFSSQAVANVVQTSTTGASHQTLSVNQTNDPSTRHRSGSRPEHTLAAYELAIEQGADFIEPDLVLTKDDVFVARHENEISGTTDVAAHPEFAARRTTKTIDGQPVTGWFTEDFTLAELRTLRAKERLPQLRPANAAYDGQETIPTFAEVIALAKAHGVGIYPETKHPTYFASIGKGTDAPLVAALTKAGWTTADAPVFIQSFEVNNLKALKKLTKIRLIQLMNDTGGPADHPVDDYATMATPAGLKAVATYAWGIGPNKVMIAGGKPLVRDAH